MTPQCGHPVPVRNSAGEFCPYCVTAGRVGVLPDLADAETHHTVEWLARHYVLVRWNGDEIDVRLDGTTYPVPEWPEAFECSDRQWCPQWTREITEALIFPSEEAAQEVRVYAENGGDEVEVMAVADFMELAE